MALLSIQPLMSDKSVLASATSFISLSSSFFRPYFRDLLPGIAFVFRSLPLMPCQSPNMLYHTLLLEFLLLFLSWVLLLLASFPHLHRPHHRHSFLPPLLHSVSLILGTFCNGYVSLFWQGREKDDNVQESTEQKSKLMNPILRLSQVRCQFSSFSFFHFFLG